MLPLALLCVGLALPQVLVQRDAGGAASIAPRLVIPQAESSAPLTGCVLPATAPGQGLIRLAQGVEADQPIDVAVALGGTVAVVLCRDTSNLEVHALATGVRLGIVALPSGPVDLDLSPDRSKALIACRAANVLAVVDLATLGVERVIPVAPQPYRVVALSDGIRAVVGSGPEQGNGTFTILDWTTGQVLNAYATPSQAPASVIVDPTYGVYLPILSDFAVTPDDSRIVFPCYRQHLVNVYDLASGNILHTTQTQLSSPFRVDVSRSSSFAAVSCMSTDLGSPENHVLALDLNTYQERTLASGSSIYFSNLRITPDESRVLLASALNGIEVVDVATGTVTDALPGGTIFSGIEFTFDDAFALYAWSDVHVVDLQSMQQVATLPGTGVTQLAASPAAHVVVTVAPLASEHLRAYDTHGAAAHALWDIELGEPAEVDAPYAVQVTRDGKQAVTSCVLSRNLALVDLESNRQAGLVPLAGPASELALTPNGRQAVVSLGQTGRVAVVDLASGQTLKELSVGGWVQEVFVSPDGTRAFARGSNGADGNIAFIDLDGTNSAITSVLNVPSAAWSWMELAPDGSTLAAIGSSAVTLVDTSSATRIASPAIQGGPCRGAWSPDSRSFAWGEFSLPWRVVWVERNGQQTSVHSVVSPVWARTLAFDAAGHLYAFGTSAIGTELAVLELASRNWVAGIAAPVGLGFSTYYPFRSQPVGDQLLVLCQVPASQLLRFSLAGAQTQLLELIDIPDEGSYGFALDATHGRVLMPASTAGDGLRWIRFGGSWRSTCTPAVPNSTGRPASLGVSATLLAGDQPVLLEAHDLPPNSSGLFLIADQSGYTQPPFSQGVLCLGGTLASFPHSAGRAGTSGVLHFEFDPRALPFGGVQAAQPGDIWYVQAWYRDVNPTPTTNLTDAAELEFR